MNTPARIVHQMDGRLRLEIAARRNDEVYFSHLKKALELAGHIQQVRTNPVAASVTLAFTSPREMIMADLNRAGVSITAQTERAPVRTKHARIPRLAGMAAAGNADPMYVAAVLFGAVGIVQAVRGEIMLPALSAFWYAASALRMASDQTAQSTRRDGHVPASPLP